MTRSPWTARLAWSLLLILVGAGGAVWALSKWDGGARFFGVTPPPPVARIATVPAPSTAPAVTPGADDQRLAQLERRLASVEGATREAAGSFGRADALLVAFAARRAVDRGVPLGYLEGLLMERFGKGHQFAVARIITAARSPDRLDQLVDDYRALGPVLRGGAPDERWYEGLRRQFGTLVAVRYADRPSPRPRARYDRALAALENGEVGAALSETLRLPASPRPEVQRWTDRARRYVATQRALDELESAALMGDSRA